MRPAWVKPPLRYTSLGKSVRGAHQIYEQWLSKL
nr:MAG TPA: hypothetical protein [Caudoviricetes sp.]